VMGRINKNNLLPRKRVSPRNPFSVRYSTDLVLLDRSRLL
jgi:hypothetical protein